MDSSSDEEDLTQRVTPSRTPTTSQTSNSSGSSVAPSVNSSPAYSNNVYGLAQTSLPVITSSSNSASFGSQSSPVLKSPRSLYLPSGTANFPEISTNNISENFNKLPVYQGASTSTTAPNPCDIPLCSLLQTETNDDVEISDLIGLPTYPPSSTLVSASGSGSGSSSNSSSSSSSSGSSSSSAGLQAPTTLAATTASTSSLSPSHTTHPDVISLD
ncbi:unnamed protein product [Acanthosepion pharaonis]|uniref:Uncharacterized protein n=1 Tax=Acanthosepion pharaonis TaxID=158019 RepID=A0A812CAD5_ACAPH|nr:unnamed protein product [Sepia pharaonis]